MELNNIKENIQAVVDGLTPLAQKLQVPIEGLWGWALKHNYAVASVELLYGATGLLILVLGIKNGKWEKDEYDVVGTPTKWALLGIAGVLVLLAGGVWGIYDGILRLIAPEWMTAQDIMRLVK